MREPRHPSGLARQTIRALAKVGFAEVSRKAVMPNSQPERSHGDRARPSNGNRLACWSHLGGLSR